MTAPAPKLGDLLERLEAATGRDVDLGADILNTLTPHPSGNPYVGYSDVVDDEDVFGIAIETDDDAWTVGDPTHSLDAVLALIEGKLPGWGWSLYSLFGSYVAGLTEPPFAEPAPKPNPIELRLIKPRALPLKAQAPTPSLALLKALVSALSSESALSGSDQVEDRTATPGGHKGDIGNPITEQNQ